MGERPRGTPKDVSEGPRPRRFLAPEVIQTSNMDCGPAALKCVLEGHGVAASYEHLREYCQTDIDGTSFSMIEDAARRLGLRCKQTIVSVDQLLDELDGRPALVVTKLGLGTHLTVIWRAVGQLVQIMDPVDGRRWISRRALERRLYVHSMALPANKWRRWMAGRRRRARLRTRMTALGVEVERADALLAEALAEPQWTGLGSLDAAIRLVAELRSGRGLLRASEAGAWVARLVERARDDRSAIPSEYWSVQPSEQAGVLEVRGALAIEIEGVDEEARRELGSERQGLFRPRTSSPLRSVLGILRQDGLALPLVLTLGMLAAVIGTGVELLLLRALIEISGEVMGTASRILAASAVGGLWLLLLALELPLNRILFMLGRRLELRLRIALSRKLLRLPDSYFRSRPSSDLAERAHTLVFLRQIPAFFATVFRTLLGLVLCLVGVAWIDPGSVPSALVLIAVSLTVPLVARAVLNETDLRVRTHTGALGRFLLDALLGLTALRAHGAERSLAREQEGLLVQWARAARRLLRIAVGVEVIQLTVGFGVVGLAVAEHVVRHGETEGLLLLLYWLIMIPMLGRTLAELAFRYPMLRTTALRLFEPIEASDADVPAAGVHAEPPASPAGIQLALEEVDVVVGGFAILEALSLRLQAGEHVAVVGSSGAGKSTLVGLLLGWHRPARGRILVDEEEADGERISALRRETAWVDPGVRLWNRSVDSNLRCASREVDDARLEAAVDDASLQEVLDALPQGMETVLGEGGTLVSGGQGQRVRLARAMLRQEARLVLLDEAFRGLERSDRERLLGRARALWAHSTLVCVSHDIQATSSFPRVVVLEGGRIVEDGPPHELAARPEGAYRRLLDAEQEVRAALLGGRRWRRLRLVDGRLVPTPERAEAEPA